MIDWAKMTPREAWDALRAAPKVAGPWVETSPRNIARASATAKSNHVAAVVWLDGCWYAHGIRYDSQSDAIAAEDARLHALDWLLVQDERSNG